MNAKYIKYYEATILFQAIWTFKTRIMNLRNETEIEKI